MSAGVDRIFRSEGRRLAAITAVAFLAGWLFYYRYDLQVAGLPLAVITGVSYAAIVAPAAFLVFLFLPSQGLLIESMAVSRLGLSIAVASLPESGAFLLTSPLLLAGAVLGGGLVVQAIIGRQTRDAAPQTP